jgi:hypothetical protein
MPVNPTLRQWRQEEHKFKASPDKVSEILSKT